MRILQSRKLLLLIATVVVIALSISSLWLFTETIPTAFNVYWILLAAILLLAFSPWGNISLAIPENKKPTLPLITWLLKICLLELSLFAIFYGVCLLSGNLLPVLVTPQPGLFTNTLNFSLIHLGLFPFTAFALIAVITAYFSYRKNEHAYFNVILTPVLKSGPNDTVGLIANAGARAATLLALSSTIAFMSLLITSIFVPDKMFRSFSTFNPVTLITVFILLALVVSKKLSQKIEFLTKKKQVPILILFIGFIILIAFALSLLVLFFSNSSGHLLTLPTPIKNLLTHGWKTLWEIFSLLWWASWAPIVGVFIAKMSRGYKVRTVLLGVLATPLLISIIMFFIHNNSTTTTPPHLTTTITDFMIPLVGFLFAFLIFTSKTTFSMVIQTYLPKPAKLKYRPPHHFIIKVFNTSMIILYFYLACGIPLLCISFLVGVFILSFLILWLPFSLIMNFIKYPNQNSKTLSS